MGYVLVLALAQMLGVFVAAVCLNWVVSRTDLLRRLGLQAAEYRRLARWLLAAAVAIIIVEVVVGLVTLD
jgi:hypothetical protein